MRKRYLAAKVNINSAIYSPNVKDLIDLIPVAILTYPEWRIGRSKWVWRFSELKQENEKKIIHGNLIKTRFEYKNVYNKEIKKTEKVKIDDAAYESYFLYNYETEILIFEENSQVKREEFIIAFEKVVFNSSIDVGEISVQLLPSKNEIRSEIESMEVLTKIEFNLIHPNFVPDEAYKDLDDILHKEQATKMKTTLENPHGLNKNGKMIQSGIDMVSKGYGGVNAYGFSRVRTYGNRRKMKKSPLKFRSRDTVHMIHTDEELEKSILVSKLTQFAATIKNMLF
jgi:hypothetical protein